MESQPSVNSGSLPRVLKLFLLVALLLNAVALCSEAIGRIRHWGAPYNSPILNEGVAVDLKNFLPQFQYIHTPQFFTEGRFPFSYPAAVAPFYGLFANVHRPAVPFEALLFLIAITVAVIFARTLHRRGNLRWSHATLFAAGTFVLSYPLLFEAKQGNMELFTLVFTAGGVYLFLRERYHPAAVLFGIAIAMKMFPFVYLGLFLSRRRWLPILTSAVSAAAMTLLSLRYISPSLSGAWHGISSALAAYQERVLLGIISQIGFDHSLFALVKRLLHHLGLIENSGQYLTVLHVYMLTVALVGLLLYFFRIRFLPVVNQVATFCIVSILLPPCSFDYTLLHLYIPFVILAILAVNRGAEQMKGLPAAFALLAVLTSIQTEFIWHGATYGGQVKALVLVALFVVALRFPFSPAFMERNSVVLP